MSQISDAKLDFYSASLPHALAQDRLFIADHLQLALSNGSEFVFGMTIGDKPVTFFEMFLTARSSSQVLVQMKEDAVYSGGIPMQFLNANRELSRNFPPFTNASSGVTEDTAGTIVRRLTLLGSTDKKDTSTAGVTGGAFGLLLRKNTVYTYHVTNQDPTDAMDFDLQLSVAVSA